MRTSALLVTVFVVIFSAPSFGATLVPVVGTPEVNSGSGFRPITATVELRTGDQVMVPPGGSAQIVYPDSCRVSVAPGQVAVVAPASPCAQGLYTKAPVLVTKAPVVQADDNTGLYLLGAAAVGVGVWTLTNGPPPSPSSP